MAIKFFRKTLVLAVLEEDYGVDPGSGYTAILVNEGTDINAESENTERNTFRPTFSPDGHVVGAKRWNKTIQCELKGGGVDTGSPVAPETDILLQCSGLKKQDALVINVDGVDGSFQPGEVVELTAGNDPIGTVVDFESTGSGTGILYVRDATLANAPDDNDGITGRESEATADADGDGIEAIAYRPTSERSEMASATIHWYIDGIRYISTGVRGNLDLNLNVNSFGVMNFAPQGIWKLPTDEANPSAAFSLIRPPVVKNIGMHIGDWDMAGAAGTAFEVNLNNQITLRNNFNALDGLEGIEISGRETSGSVDPEIVTLSEYNPWTKWQGGDRERLFARVGSEPGERIRVLVPRAQYQEIGHNNRDGIAAYALSFSATGENEAAGGVGGDDEIYYFFY